MRPKKILLIEDNDDIRNNTSEILELSNYQCGGSGILFSDPVFGPTLKGIHWDVPVLLDYLSHRAWLS